MMNGKSESLARGCKIIAVATNQAGQMAPVDLIDLFLDKLGAIRKPIREIEVKFQRKIQNSLLLLLYIYLTRKGEMVSMPILHKNVLIILKSTFALKMPKNLFQNRHRAQNKTEKENKSA